MGMVFNMDKEKISAVFFVSIYLVMFTAGLAVLSTGAVLPEIIKDFDISYDMAGLLLSLQAAGNMSALVISGILSDFIGRKAILVSGSLMIAAGFLGIAFTSSAIILFILIFISGCGWGISNILSGVMNDITGGSAKHLNRLHIFFAVGAFTAPFFVIFVSSLGMDWRVIIGAIGALSVCSAILLTKIKIPQSKRQKSTKLVSFEAFKQARYYIFIAIAFTYTAVETVMNGWITTYFQDTGILTAVQAKVILSLVWVSIMLGRVTISIFGDKIKKEYIIIICACVILICSAFLVQLSSFIGVAVCVFALGLGLSALLPTALANAAAVVKSSGLALGILLSAGGLGAAVGPAVTGITAEYLGVVASIRSAVVFAVILLIAAFINYIIGRRAKV